MVYSFVIEPGSYDAFDNESEQMEKCKEWGLLSEKASKSKAFFYKGNGMNLACSVIGFIDHMTAVIAFENEQKHCIHPSYLKEMQAASYSQRLSAAAEGSVDSENKEIETPQEAAPSVEAPKAEAPKADQPPKAAAKKEKAQKLQLPEDKVKMTAVVQQFTTVPNHFTDTEDEVVIYEAVSIEESETEVGTAWSSHSATIKKLDLTIGDKISFEAKIVAKKLTKHPVPYKINNPSKIQKEQS